MTTPKKLRERYHLTEGIKVRLVPKKEGILIKPKAEDPIGHLKSLAKAFCQACCSVCNEEEFGDCWMFLNRI